MEEASWMRNRGGDIMEEASWRRAWLARGDLRPGGCLGPENVRFLLGFHDECELREAQTRTGATQRSRSIDFYHAFGGRETGRKRAGWEEKLSTLAAGNRARKTLR